ncbi:MAG: rhodanese-like domain-containing protein [Melioribacteraceae bacterium]
MKTLIYFNILFLTAILFVSCLEESNSLLSEFGYENAAELLVYLEGNNDYINSNSFPSIISAEEVNDNLSNCLVIDIRSQEEFIKGHISTAINIQNSNLFEFLRAKQNLNLAIVLVSSSGQTASYYTGLLRIYGYNNVFALRYGMAAWHSDFADIWTNLIPTGRPDEEPLDYLDNKFYSLPNYSNLPNISYENKSLNIKQKLEGRIAQLLQVEFLTDSILNSDGLVLDDTRPSVLNVEVISQLDSAHTSFENMFVICYGSIDLYLFPGSIGGDEDGHLVSAVFYDKNKNTFSSSTNLQKIPLGKTIVVYSNSGHSSAFVVAYLRVLGYDAKSLLFGGNSLSYRRMKSSQVLSEFTFKEADIMNYPYEGG